MKTTITTLIFSIVACLAGYGQLPMLFTATDINGDNHDIQDYLNQDKPVLIHYFSPYDGNTWLKHESGAMINLYTTLGQGGTEDYVVLYVASNEFQSVADIASIDYSSQLGVGYEDLDITENNPIPIILAADNPSIDFYEYSFIHWACSQFSAAYVSENPLDTNTVLSYLFDQCCVTLEPADAQLLWDQGTLFAPLCNPTELWYHIRNTTATEQTDLLIEVNQNGVAVDTIFYQEILEACTTLTLQYINPAFQEGDEIHFSLLENDANLNNNDIFLTLGNVDTVGTVLKIENQIPASPETPLGFIASNGFNGSVEDVNNYTNYLYLNPGCYSFSIYADTENNVPIGELMIGSVNEFDQYVDTLFYGPFVSAENFTQFTLNVQGEPVPQQTWGYVFEDVNITGQFSSTLPRIQGVEVNHGPYTTFTDANGYYSFPEAIQGEDIEIVYDEMVWPVYTTPNAGIYTSQNFIHNFGLNSDDPFWNLDAAINGVSPFLCEQGLWSAITVYNNGNQFTNGTLTVTYDPLLTIIDFDPEPIAVDGNQVTFSISEIPMGGIYGYETHFEDISADLLGTPLSTSYTITTYDNMGDVAETSSGEVTDTLMCAYDPNDKYGYPLGIGEQGLIPLDQSNLKYRIRFQNTGNFPATTVVIRDTIPEELNWDSFAPISASHNYSIMLNENSREVVWTFNNIMLPDSASDPLGSIGNLWFDVDLNPLSAGDMIRNKAYIFFDQNPPIITNTSLHTLSNIVSVTEVVKSKFSVFPNPVNDIIYLRGDFISTEVVRIRDLSGRTVLIQNLSTNTLDVSSLQSGVYLISIDNYEPVKLMVLD